MFQDLINDTVSHYSDGQWQSAAIISAVILFSSLLLHMIIFIVVLNAVASTLMTFEPIRRIGVSLFASAGVAGIILGFAAQKLIGNVLWLVFRLPSPNPLELKMWWWLKNPSRIGPGFPPIF